jgi:UDP-N-acetylmuramoyl-tripeptide--D-alanyl-D-alanine ligase
MLISNAALKMNGELKGQDVEFSSVSIDTRTIKPGDLFVALRGPNFDGHEYLDIAKKNGAVAAMVSKSVDASLPTILVKDTWSGLGQLAAEWRAQFHLPTVAITGSCGKTTLKEMTAAILSLKGKTHFTQGNFNNDIGVPLTLLRLSAEDEYAVIELGANHLGEIAYTANLTQPDVAVVINAGDAHIEGFGSRENVAKAKGEVFQSLSADGIAVLNRDDAFYSYWQKNTSGAKQVCFSLENINADYFGSQLRLNQSGKYQFVLNCDAGTIEISLPLLGRFNVLNAIAAAAVAHSVGANLEEIKAGLESVKAIKGRLYPVVIGSQYVIDDTYNANPVSVHAAIDLLADASGKTCLVLGDMAELGVHSPSLHREVGAYAAQQSINHLIVVGKHASDYLVGFATNKGAESSDINQKGSGFDSCEEVAQFVYSELKDASILIKGSRSAEMERVIIHLQAIANEKSNNVEGQG